MSYFLRKVLIIVALVVLISGCDSMDSHKTVSEFSRQLQSVLDDIVSENEAVPGAALHLEIPRLGFSWSGAAGFADRTNKIKLTPQNPIRIASNTKTFVAAAILRLYEQNRIDLDSSIDKYLSASSIQILKEGGYNSDSNTGRHLLTHTSGLFDYTESNEYSERYEADVNHRWTQKEQLQGAMDWGDPYGTPGEAFHYSDTGYILLGEILEQVTGMPLATALRTLIGYKALGLTSTWLETMEPAPTGIPDRAHQYEGSFDTYTIDPSVDLYGGGGLASTIEDLARFMQAIFTGRVFSKSATIKTMLSTVPAKKANSTETPQSPKHGVYCMGVEITEIDGVTVYINYGYWGTMAAYIPSLDLAIGATVNQHEGTLELCNSIISSVLKILDKSGIEKIES
jgi:D-alanyl-D-alanine carboxypeptidase